MRSGNPVLLLLILVGLALVGFSLSSYNNQYSDNDTMTTTTPGSTCNRGISKTVKIIDNTFGTDAYLMILYSTNSSLVDFQVRYNYTLPRPMFTLLGSMEIYIDGDMIYQGKPIYQIDIPAKYEDGREHEITVVHKCR